LNKSSICVHGFSGNYSEVKVAAVKGISVGHVAVFNVKIPFLTIKREPKKCHVIVFNYQV